MDKMRHCKKLFCVCAIAAAGAHASAPEAPPPPGPESWTFRRELAEPAVYRARASYDIDDAYGLTGRLAHVKADIVRYFASAPAASGRRLVIRRGEVDGYESYRLDVEPPGDVVLTAGDDDGIRRAVYWFEDRESAGDIAPVVRRPWVRNRISRCYFGPIKRPPHNRDELMDDVDYYPEAYLERLAHEGVNGLWLTVEWRDLVETLFTKRSPEAKRRLAKLRRTIDRCLDYGIKTWVFAIEPKCVMDGDPLLSAHPELFSTAGEPYDCHLMCPSRPEALRYIEESVRDLFVQAPGLGGLLMIANGERLTTCLSVVDPVTGESRYGRCAECGRREPWQLYEAVSKAVVGGIRAAGSQAQYISWFYHPQPAAARAEWVCEAARHAPKGTVFAYNFESGAESEQLGALRHGGDYWLSYVGPSRGFSDVACAVREAGGELGAKIQVGCSHEVATLPFVPVPGLLYRKYRAMREAGVSTVLQCWYFGNCPGVMNKAAGELAFETFEDDEESFLRRLAAPEWRDDAACAAAVWKDLSDAYAHYPLSNAMQYYGPFHAGVAWPLLADVEMRPLARTWRPNDPPSGDAIGEALDEHTLGEAAELARRMAAGSSKAEGAIADLETRWRDDGDRMRDLALMRALGLQFASAADILSFYEARSEALTAGRGPGRDTVKSRAALRRMDELAEAEVRVSEKMLPLAEADSRLGFHSEAEVHLYFPDRLRWRIAQLAETRRRIAEIDRILAGGGEYPTSAFEASSPVCRVGEWTEGRGGARFRILGSANGRVRVEVSAHSCKGLRVLTMNRYCTAPYGVATIGDGVGTTVVETPGDAAWIFLGDDNGAVWPVNGESRPSRLRIGALYPSDFGRIVWGHESRSAENGERNE